MYNRGNYAVSEVISFIIVITIITSSVASVMFWALPYMDNRKAETRSDSALIQFTTIDSVIQNVLFQGSNSTRYVNFVTDDGYVYLSSRGERFIIYYSLDPEFDFNVTGLDDDEDFLIEIFDGIAGFNSYDLNIYLLYENSPANPSTVSISELVVNNIGTNSILYDAVLIEISDSTPFEIVGRIWLFDLGSIRYETQANSGAEYNIIAENEGVISGNKQSSYLMDEPKNILDADSYVMRILQLRPVNDVSIGSGSATYRFLINYSDNSILENKVNIPEDCQLKIKVFGDYADSWTRYFDQEVGFERSLLIDFGGEYYYYLNGGIDFTLVNFLFNLDVKVVK